MRNPALPNNAVKAAPSGRWTLRVKRRAAPLTYNVRGRILLALCDDRKNPIRNLWRAL